MKNIFCVKKIKKIVAFSSVFLFLVLTTICCNNQKNRFYTQYGIYSLITISDTLNYVCIKTDSTENMWKLPYPVYHFSVGDIDANGIEDLMVGVIKTTRFDKTKSKRLFIFQNYEGYVRPLWLGSRLGQPLVDFTFLDTKEGPRIRSIELGQKGLFQVAEYKWQSFGLKFTKYIKQELALDDAYSCLKYE